MGRRARADAAWRLWYKGAGRASFFEENEDVENDTSKNPKALPDEALDEAAGGILPYVEQDAAKYPGFQGGVFIPDGTSKTATGYLGGVTVAAGDVNGDGAALKIADGSVKPGG
jgi:hypothetical protein